MNAVTPSQIVQQAARVPAGSQATNIEAARAIAEVQAMFMVAKNNPRDEGVAMKRALQACAEWSVASRAFFSFPRGKESVTGESIVLATELARCWGNVDYGIMELARDDNAGHTEMLAFARDLETNTRSSQTFIVPHSRDTRNGRKALTDMRDIYENNANNGARRLRECIFRVLPSYVKNAAADRCREVLERGQGDKPLPKRIAEAIEYFSSIGINEQRLIAKHGPTSGWTGVELANLEIAYTSIKRGETTADEAFPKAEENVSDEVRKVVESRQAKAEPEPTQSAIPEWIGEETRLQDAIYLAGDRAGLDAVEKDFLSIKAKFPDDAAKRLQDEIDAKFREFAEAE
ncbi:MAG: hypothetical protein ACOVQ0_16420 [Novosphingobium sp.]|uniref:hypothetical protein n=1 Tax=Novosphingobium sp. TaxID=1874826 RepID=UPI003B9CF0F4